MGAPCAAGTCAGASRRGPRLRARHRGLRRDRRPRDAGCRSVRGLRRLFPIFPRQPFRVLTKISMRIFFVFARIFCLSELYESNLSTDSATTSNTASRAIVLTPAFNARSRPDTFTCRPGSRSPFAASAISPVITILSLKSSSGVLQSTIKRRTGVPRGVIRTSPPPTNRPSSSIRLPATFRPGNFLCRRFHYFLGSVLDLSLARGGQRSHPRFLRSLGLRHPAVARLQLLADVVHVGVVIHQHRKIPHHSV